MRARHKAPLLVLLACLAVARPAFAVLPGEVLDDPALEARARAISSELRCLVCQNQSIDDSDADLAHDLRLLVRERLKAGDSDREVIDFIVARYGEFVLLLAGGTFLFVRRRNNKEDAVEHSLDPQEQADLERLLDRR